MPSQLDAKPGAQPPDGRTTASRISSESAKALLGAHRPHAVLRRRPRRNLGRRRGCRCSDPAGDPRRAFALGEVQQFAHYDLPDLVHHQLLLLDSRDRVLGGQSRARARAKGSHPPHELAGSRLHCRFRPGRPSRERALGGAHRFAHSCFPQRFQALLGEASMPPHKPRRRPPPSQECHAIEPRGRDKIPGETHRHVRRSVE